MKKAIITLLLVTCAGSVFAAWDGTPQPWQPTTTCTRSGQTITCR